MSGHPVTIGTAGHIDHGKTALVKALTGIDTDRLKEEQRRGITIELGFAHLLLGEFHFGVVDVPGHERFIKSMVAGAGGIDLVLLVVAADEGIMPQTREHLDICQLLGVQRGLVALTKADLVDAEWIQLVQEDLRQFLTHTSLQDAPIVPCSSSTGLGIEEIKSTLVRLATAIRPRDPQGLLRLPLDRVFTIKGFGTVVTGTLLSGTLALGDDVRILPDSLECKVRGLQVHGLAVEQTVAGQRTAVNLGGVDRAAVARGEVLVHPHTLTPSSMLDAFIRLLPGHRKGLPSRSKVLFHLGTRQQEASCILLEEKELQAGETGLAQLRFEQPVVALPGDRFILRGFAKQENYGTTVGGGQVLRVLSPKLRPRDKQAVALLRRTLDAPPLDRLALELLAAGPSGLTRLQLQERLPLLPADLDRLLLRLRERSQAIRFDKDRDAVVHADHFQSLLDQIRILVDRFHEEHPLETGISREELRSRLGQGIDPRLFFVLLQSLEKNGELSMEREFCRRPGHTVKAAGQAVRPLADRLLALYGHASLGPPRDSDLPSQLGTDPSAIASALKLLVEEGSLVRIGTLYFTHTALEALRIKLTSFLEKEGQISAAQFKELVGQSRKFSIPLAEHFDAQKVTLRVGDLRKLRR